MPDSQTKKTRILYLFPGPIFGPNFPDFRDRFLALSNFFEGEIYTWVVEEKYSCINLGDFVFRGFPRKNYGFSDLNQFIFRCRQALFVLKNVLDRPGHKKFDVVVCYEPNFSGMLGCVIKLFTGARLIVEINNFSFRDSMTHHYGTGLLVKIKIFVSSVFQGLVYRWCDRIKILTEGQRESLNLSRWESKISVFHDFVPTHYFRPVGPGNGQKVILYAGWPFYLKGVDILIPAFNLIKDRHPLSHLCLLGYRLKEDLEKYGEGWDMERVSVKAPVYYDKLKEIMESCYCFVLPSRTEGLPRVLIEAMACAKPLIGTKVGGIPDLIKDGVNGFLIKADGDVQTLADKLDAVLSDEKLAKRLGEAGLNCVNDHYSSDKYCEHFEVMIKKVMD